ncbi:hypothetical protein HPB51_017682 [Rhipicephalus microplus]|uniref:Asparaginase n=1 Tax=Rhipicephalus microplus TaxID=6941 RepID=A0A9J6E2K1_RHIMP|nr:hypothetical protein HPB51_017682 [Rhipicephalus microplus]
MLLPRGDSYDYHLQEGLLQVSLTAQGWHQRGRSALGGKTNDNDLRETGPLISDTSNGHYRRKTEHALLVGPWADDFAREMGIPRVDNGSLVSEKAKQRLEELQCFHSTVYQSINVNHKEHDTVGAVAVDTAGHVACATSTGGLTGQRCGRVGDSPIVGAGGFADDSVCAVSTTGHGEAIARSCLAYDMAVRLQAGQAPCSSMPSAQHSGQVLPLCVSSTSRSRFSRLRPTLVHPLPSQHSLISRLHLSLPSS